MTTEQPRRKILIVEDDPDLGPLLEMHLQDLGFALELVADGTEGFLRLKEGTYALAVLDVNLPGLDGFEITERLRKLGQSVPILLLTSRGEELDKIVGFSRGADDYLTKPFSAGELVARIKSLLRRAEITASLNQANSTEDEIHVFGQMKIDPSNRAISINGTAVELTALEFDLLYFLALRAGKVVTRETILEEVWRTAVEAYDASLNSILSRLRKKIEVDPLAPRYIRTVRGVGYRFALPEEL